MKNKGLTYGLIVVVGIVWYQVFMRVKSNFDADATPPPQPMAAVLARKIVKPDDFRLRADYRDPFSGSLAGAMDPVPATNVNQTLLKPEASAPKPKPQPVVVPWPSIKYYGLVRKTSSEHSLTMLAIDGYFYKVRQGEQVLDDIYIVKVTRDYVQVKYRKEVRTFDKVDY